MNTLQNMSNGSLIICWFFKTELTASQKVMTVKGKGVETGYGEGSFVVIEAMKNE